MITYLEGRVEEKQPTRVVLDVAGIGYEINIPLSSYDRLPSVGSSCRILIHDHVREDEHRLFGFSNDAERSMFRLLLGISGIGPKIALSALSGLSARELTAAVVEGDVKRLSSVSGIGKRMAERIVVELRDKISQGDALEALSGSDEEAQDVRLRDAVLALVSLGYKQEQASQDGADGHWEVWPGRRRGVHSPAGADRLMCAFDLGLSW